MRNRPKPNKAAYASNGTPIVKKSTDTAELIKSLELAKSIAAAPQIPVRVLTTDKTKAEVIPSGTECS